MNKTISPKIVALTFGILTISFLAAFYVIAWQEPSQAPPGGNVATPLNTSNIGQSKAGGLILNTGGATNGLVIDKGNLCIGTDCRNTWPATTVMVVNGSTCPAGYSPVLFHYPSVTCKGTHPSGTDCTTPPGWGTGNLMWFHDAGGPPNWVNAFQDQPSCPYDCNQPYTSSCIFICYSSTIDKVLCSKD